MDKPKYKHSRAEQKFCDFVSERWPAGTHVTKKGLPDFMIVNEDDEVIGFVEVKRTDLSDTLRKEQRMFQSFCKKWKIPYRVWSPIMATERWRRASEYFRIRMAMG